MEGAGDSQKVEEEDRKEEDEDDEDDVELPEGISNWATATCDGVASSLGDLS